MRFGKALDSGIEQRGAGKPGEERSPFHGLDIPNSHCPCICREIVMDALKSGESNNFREIAYRLGKEGYCYYLGLLSGVQFCLEQGEKSATRICDGDSAPSAEKEDCAKITFCWLPPALAAFCRKALEAGIETEYVGNLVRSYNLFPEKPTVADEAWPWPVKIFVLGKFELVLDGRAVSFSGRAQRKPLQMLKMLVALGGNGVREEELSDLLWPDADGDRAHSSFTTTLSRLRLILGLNRAIEFRDGSASLNPRYCWVDLRAFEEVFRELDSFLGQMEAAGERPGRSLSTVVPLAERAMELYGGPLLPGEAGHLWVAPMRRRASDRFLRLVIGLGRHLETLEEWGKAARYYRLALDTDETADEELFQRLMICHHRLGQPARTIEVYRQCRKTLFSTLGIKPSQKTEAIYRELVL